MSSTVLPLWLCILPPSNRWVARHRLCKHVPAAMNTYAMEEFLDAFSMRFVSYQRKVGEGFVPELAVLMLRRSRMTLKHVTWILAVTWFLYCDWCLVRFACKPDSVQHSSKVTCICFPCIAIAVAIHLLIQYSPAVIRVNRLKITNFPHHDGDRGDPWNVGHL
jgi:hypothetical protein